MTWRYGKGPNAGDVVRRSSPVEALLGWRMALLPAPVSAAGEFPFVHRVEPFEVAELGEELVGLDPFAEVRDELAVEGAQFVPVAPVSPVGVIAARDAAGSAFTVGGHRDHHNRGIGGSVAL